MPRVEHFKTKPTSQWLCADSECVSHIDWKSSIQGLHTQLFSKWSFVLVYPTSLIHHKSKYSIIFLYLRCDVSECQTIIYCVNYRLCTSVTFQWWQRGAGADVWLTLFVCVCVCVCVCVLSAAITSTVPYTSRINFKHLLSYHNHWIKVCFYLCTLTMKTKQIWYII